MSKDTAPSLLEALGDLEPLIRGIFENETITAQEAQAVIKSMDAVRLVAKIQREGVRKKRKGQEKAELNALMREADELGVNLCNSADEIRVKLEKSPEISEKHRNHLMAAVWHTALRLVHFSTPRKAGLALSIRLLSVVSQTMEALIDAGDVRAAEESALIGAEALENAPANHSELSTPDIHQRDDAEIGFLMARSKLAVFDQNDTLALEFLRQASKVPRVLTEDQAILLVERYLSLVEMKEESSQGKTQECLAIPPTVWLEHALSMAQDFTNGGQSDNLRLLQVSLDFPKYELHVSLTGTATAREILKRAGHDKEQLARAATLLESIEGLNSECTGVSAESMYEARILKIQVLKNQKSSEGAMRHAFDDLIKGLDLTEDNLNEVFAHLRALTTEYPDLPLSITQTFLNFASNRVARDQQAILDRILYEGILLARALSKSQPRAAIQSVSMMCEVALARGGGETAGEERVLLTACQTLLWNLGATAEKKPSRLSGEAAEWYLLAGHPGFSVLGTDHTPRKSALSHISTKNIPAALELLDKCPQDQASTFYLYFLAAVERNDAEAARRAIENMVTCLDVDGRHLLLITSLAEREGSHSFLVVALQGLLGTMKRPHSNCLVKAELIDIIRQNPLARLIEYLQTAAEALQEEVKRYSEQLEGIIWLYKSAYNTAMKGIDEGVSTDLLGDMFDLSARLMDAHAQIEGDLGYDTAFQIDRSGAMFACFCGKLFHYRDLPAGEAKVRKIWNLRVLAKIDFTCGVRQSRLLAQLLNYLPACQQAIPSLPSSHPQAAEMGSRANLEALYYLELLCEAQSWKEVDAQLKSEYPDCPMEIVYCALDKLLELCLISNAADVVRFSRWTRSIITLILDRGPSATQDDLMFFFEKVTHVLASPIGSKAYPQDELEWLLATAWNKSLHSSQHGQLQDALKWCELALDLNDFTSQPIRNRESLRAHQAKLTNELRYGYEYARPRQIEYH
ncbi:hypothetical protein I316_06091 [Kwoniella heveanensis BCC8398]|uniref:Protein ZIP4 homolog n=1 Tax=Kwoniella heveanensis BCC8398 TaxID=1296120 RepID=A0A1B9GMC3_9TREE|nr:hypothetical protein I316_06091 [Kwoniella heveanensis BCC8398]